MSRVAAPALRAASVFTALLFLSGCTNPFGREYEYEEQLYLAVDGSATLVVNSSIAALIALRGLPIDPSSSTAFDADALRRQYEQMGCRVLRVGRPWYRHGRRFIQVRLSTDDIRTLSQCVPVAWSTYRFVPSAGEIEFKQTVGPPAGGNPGTVNWTGNEIVAFRVHVPSKVLFHNVRRLRDNSTGETERGNILTWEQRLADRRNGAPVDMQIRMDPQSILYRTLWLFGGSFVAAVAFLGALIWWTVRKGRRRHGRST